MKLIIVQRSKIDTYQRLREQFAGDQDVTVMLERREPNRERLTAPNANQSPYERRRLKKSFEGRDFIVVSNTKARPN
jgi:hypothetical protein